MTTFATLDAISIATPDGTRLFSNLSLSIGIECIGLVGRNGAGKSSLLDALAGRTRPADGAVLRAGTVGTLAQDWPDHISVAEALGVADGLALIRRILAGQVSNDDLDAVDWTLEERVDGALRQVGLPAIALDRAVATLSGGQRTRVGVARILVEDPDLLLLDEPSNNLDAAGRSLIADLIRGWRGGVVVASHDRRLLEDMDRIVELTPIGVRIVGGGWSAFAALRDAERARAASELARSVHHLRDATRAAQQQREAKERRDKVGRAAAAKGSEPRILLGARAARAEESGGRARRIALDAVEDAAARAEAARGNVEVLTPLAMALPPSGLPAGRTVLVLEAATVAAGDRLLGPWTFDVRAPERIRVCGPNGAGKTSLLRCAAGLVAPADGTAWRAEGRVAYLDQHVRLLDPGTSILDNLRRLNPELDEREAHAACARFAFRNHDAERLVGMLSGGERLRAGLACTFSGERPPWLLILDEPTNHLDIEAIEILEKALRGFDGALLVVSHDEAFLEAAGIDREILVGAEPA